MASSDARNSIFVWSKLCIATCTSSWWIIEDGAGTRWEPAMSIVCYTSAVSVLSTSSKLVQRPRWLIIPLSFLDWHVSWTASGRATWIDVFLLPLWIKLYMIWKILCFCFYNFAVLSEMVLTCWKMFPMTQNNYFVLFKAKFYISCITVGSSRRKSNSSRSACNFAAHNLIRSFERRVSRRSREHILAEKNIRVFLIFRGYVEHTSSSKFVINKFFTLRLVTLHPKLMVVHI